MLAEIAGRTKKKPLRSIDSRLGWVCRRAERGKSIEKKGKERKGVSEKK
jgi:hypothetical protein